MTAFIEAFSRLGLGDSADSELTAETVLAALAAQPASTKKVQSKKTIQPVVAKAVIPAPVRELPTRQVIWKDNSLVFQLSIGKEEMRHGQYPTEDGFRSYSHFVSAVTGGFVKVYVHTSKVLPGLRMRAWMEVIQNTYPGGEKIWHVDFHPLSDDDVGVASYQLYILGTNQSVRMATKEFALPENPQLYARRMARLSVMRHVAPFSGRLVIGPIGQTIHTKL